MKERDCPDDLEGKVDLLLDWQRVVNAPITRLIHDQAYRDRRVQERDKTWRRRAVWSGVVLAGVGIVAGIEALGEKVVHVLAYML